MDNRETWRDLAEKCRDGDTDYLRRCADIQRAQDAYLRRLLAENRDTKFGQAHGFSAIKSYADYAAAVPVSPYETFAPYIEAELRGETGQLTAAPALFVETTGGSTAGAKIVPYTEKALENYWRALRPWLADTMRQRGLSGGRTYFALSPAGRKGGERIGVLPLGSPKGFAYFGAAGPCLAKLSVAPPALSDLSDYEAWCFATCLHLLSARDLALIWVWSPTYLTELVRAMQRMKPALIRALASGAAPESLGTVPLPPRDTKRAGELDNLIGDRAIDTAALWPALDSISCWMDASSAPLALELRGLFPKARFQAKGLMLTEGAVTLPFGDEPGAPLAVDSGFFEFADGETVRPAWKIAPGRTYGVLMSNDSGFYRYDTGDVVEVVGFLGQAPRLVFKGRAGLTADLCGEKLTDEFVQSCFNAASPRPATFAFLAASDKPHPHYVLCADERAGTMQLYAFAAALEHQLRRNPQYEYARRLGQLSPLEIRTANGLFAHYREWATAKGRTVGNLKAVALLPELPEALGRVLSKISREE